MANRMTPSQRLHEDLRRMIVDAQPGERLLSEPELARQLGVSRATLREAMRTFEIQGLITRRQGVGTFVLRPSHVIESGLEVLESIETMACRIGLQVSLGEWKVEQRPASEPEAAALGLSAGSEVLYISRAMMAENRPVAFLEDALPAGLLTREEVVKEFSGSILDLLLRRDLPALVNSRCEIGAIEASSEIARALNIQRGDALLRFIASLFAVDGSVVDYSHSYFLPGYFRFHVVRALGKVDEFKSGGRNA